MMVMNVSYAYFFAKYVCSNGLEKSVQLCIDSVDDLIQVFGVLFEFEFIYIYYQKGTVLVVFDPLFVAVIQTFKIVDTDAAFVFTTSLLDLCHQVRDG